MADRPIKGEQIFEPGYLTKATSEATALSDAFKILETQLKDILRISKGKLSVAPDPQSLSDLEKQQKLINDTAKAEKNLLELRKKSAQAEKAELQLANAKAAAEKKANAEKAKQIKLQQQQVGIINNLRQELKEVTKAWAASTDAQQLDANVTGSLAQRKKILTENLKRLEEATGDHRRSVGDYGKALKGLNPLLSLLERYTGIDITAIRELSQAVKGATGVMKIYNLIIGETVGVLRVLKLAIAATGIGAILLLLGNAIRLYMQLKEANEKLANATEIYNKQLERLKENLTDNNNLLAQNEALQIALAKSVGKSEEEIFKIQQSYRNKRIDALQIFNAELIARINKQGRESTDEEAKTLRENNDEIERLKNEFKIAAIDFETKKNEEIREKKRQASQKELDDFRQFQKELFDTQSQGIEDNFKSLQADLIKRRTAGLISEKAYQAELYEIRRSQLEINYQRGLILEGEYLLQLSNLEKEYSDFLQKEYEKRLSDEKKYFNDRQKSADDAAALRQQRIDEELKAEDERNKKSLEMAKELEQQLFELSKDRLDERRKMNEAELKEIDSRIQEQTARAIAGQSNELDFLMKQRVEALKEQAAIERAERRRQQAERLANTFLGILEKNGGDIVKALEKTLQGKAVAASIAGSAEQGTEDTGTVSGGGLDGKGGRLWMLHDNEGVVTKKANKENEGLVAAMNSGKVSEYFAKNYINYITGTDRTKSEVLQSAQNGYLLKEIQELRNDIKNKKELTIYWNELDERVMSERENGIRNIVTHKKSNFSNRKSPFIK